MSFKQGLYQPINPHKYLGELSEITYRSSWELKMFRFLDSNPYVLAWASEPVAIPYMKPVIVNGKPAMKKARYFPDIYVEYVDNDGKENKEMIEIKPLKQTKKSRAKDSKIRIQENYTLAVNMAKWEAAREWCALRNITFKISTEKSIYK